MLPRLRSVIHSADPAVTDVWKWNMPAGSCGGILGNGGTYCKAVILTFAKRASLPDPAGLFNPSP